MACLNLIVEALCPWWVHKDRVSAEVKLGQLSLGTM